MVDDPDRRSVLRSGVALCAVAVGGCLGLDDGDSPDDTDGAPTESTDTGSTPPVNESDDASDTGGNESDGDGSGESEDSGDDDSDADEPDGEEDPDGEEPEAEPDPVESWQQFQYDAQNTGSVPAPEVTEPTTAWSFQADTRIQSAPLVHRDQVFIADRSGTAYKLDMDGTEVWRTSIGGSPVRASGVVTDDRFVVPHEQGVVGLRLLDGTVEWRIETNPEEGLTTAGQPTHLTMADGTFVFGNHNEKLHAYDVATGEKQWTHRADRNSNRFTRTPAIADGSVYISDSGQEIMRLDLQTGEKTRIHEPRGYYIWSPLLYADGTIVAGTSVGRESDGIRAFEVTEAGYAVEQWHFDYELEISMGMAVRDDNLIAVPIPTWQEDGEILSIDLETGDLNWRLSPRDPWGSRPIASGDSIYYGDVTGYFRAVGLDGTLRWEMEAPEQTYPFGAVANDGVIFVSNEGLVQYVVDQ